MDKDLRKILFEHIETPLIGEELFDSMTDLVFFIKNRQGQYVVVNQSLVERCGCQRKQDLVGCTADQVYPEPLGVSYRDQDQKLLETGKPFVNHLELQIYPSGERGWCLTNKVPLRDANQTIVGLMGMSRDLHATSESKQDYKSVAQGIEYIQKHFNQPLKIAELADMVGLSHYQFEQRIHRIFELTAGQFIQKVRMDEAISRLKESDDPIVDIALDCGYSDQSTFSRQFKRAVGLSPGQYRRMIRTS